MLSSSGWKYILHSAGLSRLLGSDTMHGLYFGQTILSLKFKHVSYWSYPEVKQNRKWQTARPKPQLWCKVNYRVCIWLHVSMVVMGNWCMSTPLVNNEKRDLMEIGYWPLQPVQGTMWDLIKRTQTRLTAQRCQTFIARNLTMNLFLWTGVFLLTIHKNTEQYMYN